MYDWFGPNFIHVQTKDPIVPCSLKIALPAFKTNEQLIVVDFSFPHPPSFQEYTHTSLSLNNTLKVPCTIITSHF